MQYLDNEFDGKPKSEEIRTRKPRRHTTGSGKQTIEDIQKAKEIVEMSNSSYKEAPENSLEGTNTLGRKQLISMLKQRYGPEIENYRNTREINEQVMIEKKTHQEFIELLVCIFYSLINNS